MQLRESIEKTKIFFQETLQDLKSLFHQNIPKKPTTLITNPFSYWKSNCENPDHTIADHEYYTTFCNELESDLQKVTKLNPTATATTSTTVGSWGRLPRAQGKSSFRTRTTNLVGPVSLSVQDPSPTTTTTTSKVPAVPKESAPNRELADQMKNMKRNKKKNQKKNSNRTGNDQVSYYVLARKIKELEMMDVSDVEHVLDVEEALHYYSRLKSPAYLDIVNKFFTDMYHEISFIPPPSYSQASVSANSSRRRLSSFRL